MSQMERNRTAKAALVRARRRNVHVHGTANTGTRQVLQRRYVQFVSGCIL